MLGKRAARRCVATRGYLLALLAPVMACLLASCIGTSPKVTGSDYFTLAVIPDTQRETWTDSDTRFRNRSQWLVDNASSLNIKFVTHVGDVVDWGHVAPAQFRRAKEALSPLDGRIPYSLTIGNHDTAAVCEGGAACPGTPARIAVRNTTSFNRAFSKKDFVNLKGVFESGKVDNTFSTFTALDREWLVLNLELWPRQSVIDWAKNVVGRHRDYNVIVATHSYMEADGTISTSRGGYGSTSPRHLFDALIKVYPNIKMVVSGHVGTAASRVDVGDRGNRILSLLQCYHSETTNPLRLIRIDVANGTVTDWVYAPYTNETLIAPLTTTMDFAQ